MRFQNSYTRKYLQRTRSYVTHSGQLSQYSDLHHLAYRGIVVRFPGMVGDFLFPHSLQASSGTHAGSQTIGTGGIHPGVKRPECEADRSPTSS